jgi:hypothetical protein
VVCFYHPDKPAAGVCKHCGRGLCSECAAVVDDVLACRSRHEEEVRAVGLLTARQIFQAQRAGSAFIRNAIFYALVGVLFGGFGWYQLPFLGYQAVFFILIGIFLLYAAGANYFEARKYRY